MPTSRTDRLLDHQKEGGTAICATAYMQLLLLGDKRYTQRT
jgi:hypothetical protein